MKVWTEEECLRQICDDYSNEFVTIAIRAKNGISLIGTGRKRIERGRSVPVLGPMEYFREFCGAEVVGELSLEFQAILMELEGATVILSGLLLREAESVKKILDACDALTAVVKKAKALRTTRHGIAYLHQS